MKISCTQENLSHGLNTVSHIASKNVSLPILNNVLIVAENGIIKLTTTNLEIGVNCQVRGKMEKEGKITVQARLLADYINSLPNERIDLAVEGDNLKIKCGQAQTVIKGSSTEEFPLIPKVERKKSFSLKISDLKKAITQVIYAAASDEARPEINGVFVKSAENEITFAATDSYRLAEKKVKAQKASPSNGVIIPAKTLMELNRVLAEETEEIDFFINDNQVLFVFDGIEMVSRLIEGQYPEYQQIIPHGGKTKVELNTREFVKRVKTTSLFCKPGINDISLEVKKGEVVVSASNSQLGENISNLEAKIEGEENIIVFNYRYLLDGLASIESEEVILELTDNANPGLMKPKGLRDYIYIIMPIRQ